MKHLFLILLSFAILSTGCQSETQEEGDDYTPATGLEDPVGVAAGDEGVLALGIVQPSLVGRFATSTACALCHSNNDNATAMRDEDGDEIAPFNLWQGTMMANASRDPFWRAMVSAEIARTPNAKALIESECMRCHTPMAAVSAEDNGDTLNFGMFQDEDNDPETIGLYEQTTLDGVSCTVCHQMLPDNFGTPESFSGGFILGTERKIFGPHRDPAPGPMQNHVDYTPTFGDHVTKSEMCATCHTLFTHALTEDGAAREGAPAFPEQAPYLEWKASIYYNEGGENTECQDCHMPTTDEKLRAIKTRIARSPPGGDFLIDEREPFGRHLFVGANSFMPQLIKHNRDVLNPLASNAAFDAVSALATKRLQENSAKLRLESITNADGELSFEVVVSSEVGHKLPTGFPARRVWIEVLVLTQDGETLMHSGGFNEAGRIVDDRGDVLDSEKSGGPIEPHRELITRSDQVQIYEAVMGDHEGNYTPSLLRATEAIKDNRLLPIGATSDFADWEVIKPRGIGDDADFIGGEDRIVYKVKTGGKQLAGVSAVLRYQGLGARFMQDFFQVDTPEVRAFRSMYDAEDRTPVEMVRAAEIF